MRRRRRTTRSTPTASREPPARTAALLAARAGTLRCRPVDVGRVGVWAFLDAPPASVLTDVAAELESLGYGALWIPETVGRDPFVLAAMLLGATSELVLATGIANIHAATRSRCRPDPRPSRRRIRVASCSGSA